ncbi:MAG: hypothetical protein ACR2KQ_10910 [Actinomycetota bacterium]
MDESVVKERAQAHGDAVVSGDLRAAGADLDGAVMKKAGEVMSQLPKPLTAAEITSVSAEDDSMTVAIGYRGADSIVTVASVWAERGGQPKIIDLSILED